MKQFFKINVDKFKLTVKACANVLDIYSIERDCSNQKSLPNASHIQH